MRRQRQSLVVVIALFLGPVASLSAGTISDIFFISGPGGNGAVNHYNSDSVEITLDYTASNYIQFVASIDARGSYTVNESGSVSIVNNNTPDHWSGFRFEISSNSPVSLGAPVSDSSFSNSVTDGHIAILSGPGVDPGASFETSFTFFIAEPGFVTLRETPLVPEPSTVALAGAAAVLGALACLLRLR